jgi:hypothetical protein
MWKLCNELTKSTPWLTDEEPLVHSHVRGVRWEDPNPDISAYHVLKAHGIKRWFRQPIAWLFELQRLDSGEPELYHYSTYTIAINGLFKARHASISLPNGVLHQEDLEDFQDSAMFELEHDLNVPTFDDTVEVHRILSKANTGGLLPYPRARLLKG